MLGAGTELLARQHRPIQSLISSASSGGAERERAKRARR